MARAVMAELSSPEALARALLELRRQGYRELDAHTPYPVDDVQEALGLKRSPIPWFVLAGAAFGGSLGYLVQWFTSAVAYRLDVGGRPFHAAPAFVPITYELATLFGALVGFIAFFLLTGLPRPWHPVFEADGFESAARDRFWLRVCDSKPRAVPQETVNALLSLGALRVVIEEERE